MKESHKLIRITTVPQSLRGLLKRQMSHMTQNILKILRLSCIGLKFNYVMKW